MFLLTKVPLQPETQQEENEINDQQTMGFKLKAQSHSKASSISANELPKEAKWSSSVMSGGVQKRSYTKCGS